VPAAPAERTRRRSCVSGVRLHLLAARNGYRRGLQYRAAHMVNNLASAVFGFVYIAVWRAALAGAPATSPRTVAHGSGATGLAARGPIAPVTVASGLTAPGPGIPGSPPTAHPAALGLTPGGMAHYIALAQCLMWLTTFLPYGLGVPAAVRTGQVVADLLRPAAFWPLQMAREAGAAAYSLLYRSLPMAAVFALAVGFPLPPSAGAAAAGTAAVALGVWNALCLNYLVGVSAFWTTEARAAHWLLQSLILSCGGGTIPLRAFPAALAAVLRWLPFASLLSTPVLAWTGSSVRPDLLVSAGWAAALGCLCTCLTAAARRRLEVQGG